MELRIHNILMVTGMAIVGFVAVKFALRRFGHGDLANLF